MSEQATVERVRPSKAIRAEAVDYRELSAAAFERTNMPMVVCDAAQEDCPIVLANQSFLDLTGYRADEILGRNCRFLQGKGTLPEAIAEIRSAVADGRECLVEILNYRKDGTPFVNQLHISPIHDEDGRLAYFFASQTDVTRFRNMESLEASQHRLLKEVDHRAKNVLAVVQSVVRLSQSDNPAQYSTSVQNRVQALSRAHELLADRGWRDVELWDALRVQLAPIAGTRMRLDGPPILIPASVVQPLGLVFHELAVNAVVHGALSNAGGELEVRWSEMPEGSIAVTWRERGGKGRAGTATGFGSVILRALVEKQLGGTVTRDWTDDGLLLSMVLPPITR